MGYFVVKYICNATFHFFLQVISPWRLPEFYNRFLGRNELFEYAKVSNLSLSLRKHARAIHRDVKNENFQ